MNNQKSKLLMITCFMIIALMIVSFRKPAGGTVRGNVNPPEAGLRAFLFSGKDTLSVNVVSGTFQFSNVAVGNYNLLVQAAPPYRNAVKDGIRVIEGEIIIVGQIDLQKQ